ncbi:MAG: hypothetical protein HYZ15_02380 [Sphingobacteriales bacterium]|nr:hypothetical protein [Sphingobacteriales bacterium]
MKRNIRLFIIPVVVLFSALSLISFNREKITVDGAWTIVELQYVKPDGTATSTRPVESDVYFSGSHYSFCWTSQSTVTRDWVIADSIKLKRFNQSLVNTGIFELKDSILTTRAVFALQPMFVNGTAKFACSFRGDTLVLRGLSVISADGISLPAYTTGAHFVTKMIRSSRR